MGAELTTRPQPKGTIDDDQGPDISRHVKIEVWQGSDESEGS